MSPLLFFFDHGKQHQQNLPQDLKKEIKKEIGAFKLTTPTCMPTPAAEYSSCKWSRQPYFAIRKTVVRCPLERQVTRGFLRSSGLIPRPQVSSALPQDTSANHRTFVSFSSSLQPEGTSINTSYEWPDTVYKTFRYEHNFNQAVTFHTSKVWAK